MENGEYVQGSLWFYAPDKGAPVAFAFFFLVSGVWHLWQRMKYGSSRITWLLPWNALLFVVGFTLREVGAYMYDNLRIYISSTVFLYAAPPYYELSNYIILARLLHYIPYHAPLHPGRSISTFYCLTIFINTMMACAIPQAADPSNNAYQLATGKALVKTTLVLQLAVLVSFVSVAARWQWNCSRGGKLLYTVRGGAGRDVKRVLITLYCSCALITGRTIYRTVEYFKFASFTVPAPGAPFEPDSLSPVVRYEWFFWVFEATLMLCNCVMWNVRHPARDLPRSCRTYLAEDGIEREGLDIYDPRMFLIKVLDPFDIWGLVMGYGDKWWEPKNEGTSTGADAGLEG